MTGTFEVSEKILLVQPITQLTLRPPTIARAGTDFVQRRPIATAVQLTAGDQPVVLPSTEVSRFLTVDLPGPTMRLELRYVLSGVTVRSTPSRAGRALAALGPLSAGYSPDLPVTVTISGPGVRNLQCPAMPLSHQPCAAGERPHLRVGQALPWRDAIVVVQLDLPRPP